MGLIKDLIVSASVAAGNVASRERDRESMRVSDGRPWAMKDRAQARMRAVAGEGVAKLALSQTAHLAAKEIAKRATGETLKRVAGALARHPALAAGTVILAADTTRDAVRFARGNIDGKELTERVAGNVTGLAGSAGGAYVGAVVGSVALPFVGTIVGSVVGGVVGGIGGDTYGRLSARRAMGQVDDDA